MRPFLALAAALVFASTASAQAEFGAVLNGPSVVPPSLSPAVGRAWLSLDLTTHHAWFRIETNLAGATNAVLRHAPAGLNGPMVMPLGVVGPTYTGITNTLSTAQITDLFQGECYIAVEAGGVEQIRGQISKSFRRTLAATLNGAQAGTASPAAGTASLTLIAPENVVLFRVMAAGLMAPSISAGLYDGDAGLVGPLVATLAGGAGATLWSGVTPPLGATQVSDLLTKGLYVTIKTAAFPGGSGEIRGQVLATTESFVAELSGAQETPPNGSANTGFARLTFDPATSQLSYDVAWSGAGGDGARLRLAAPGDPGFVIAPPLAGPLNGPWVGTTPALAAAAVDALFKSGIAVEIVNAPAFPAGEIRGRVAQNPEEFGYAGPSGAGALGRVSRIVTIGLPTLGNPSYGVGVAGLLPGAPSWLVAGVDAVGYPLDLTPIGMTSHALWGNYTVLFAAPPADALGTDSMFVGLPGAPGLLGHDLYFQWLSLDAAANPLGLVASDALRAILQ